MGAGSVSALVAKGHYSTSITFEITSAECRNSAKVHGVEARPISGKDGTFGVTKVVEESCDLTFGLATSG